MQIERSRLSGIHCIEIAVMFTCLVVSVFSVFICGSYFQDGLSLMCMGLDVFGIMIASILFSSLAVSRNPTRGEEILMSLFVMETLTLSADILSWFIDGSSEAYVLGAVSRNVKNLLLLAVGSVFWLYLHTCIDLSPDVRRRGTVLMLMFTALGVLFIAANIFTECLFYVGSDGVYHRGKYLFLFYAIVGSILVICATHVIIYGNVLREKVVSVIYLGVSAILIVIQYFRLGLSLIYICPLITLTIVFVNFYITQRERALRRETEIQSEKHDAMITQIQPHFLYNALTSIMAIKGNPPETQDAICDFSKYLRENLASTERACPIPFRLEVDHVETYLSLEKMRFKEKLEYEIDAGDSMFPIPSLVLQLLVENAIRHGITMKPEGGKVVITSRRTYEGHLVTIDDDGVGFDTNAPIDERHPHRGIEFCRKILMDEVRGSLSIRSEIGKGTHVEILIPFAR